MKNSLKMLVLLMIMMMISACSKTPGKTNSKVKIVSGNFAAILSSKANNGLFFYGKSTDGKVFTKKVDTDTVDLVFPNGTWNFFAISYELATAHTAGKLPDFTGKTYCGKTTTTLNGTDASIQIDLTNSGCNDPAFSSDVKNMSEYRLPQVDFLNCKNINGPLSPTACDQNLGAKFNKGYATSFKVVAYEGKNFGDLSSPVKIAESGCARTDYSNLTGLTTSADSSGIMNMHLPTTPGNGLNLVLEVYYASGAPGTYTGCDPAGGVDVLPIADNPRMKIIVDTTPSMNAIYKLYIKTDEADVCKPPRLAPTNMFAAGFGTAGSPYAACTQAQFDLLRSQFTTYKEASIDLLTDINYNMAQIAPIGDGLTATGTPAVTSFYGKSTSAYRPVLDGRGHKISSFIIDCKVPSGTASNNDVGFFRKLGDVEIKNLVINNGVIFCDNGNNIGVLSGSMGGSSGSSFSNLKVHGHSEGNQFVGGLVGSVGTSAFDVSNVHVRGDFGSSSYAGGFFGQINLTSVGTIYQSSFSGGIHADKNGGGTPTPSYAGGIAGQATSSTGLLLNQVIVKGKEIKGVTTVGGFFGETNNVSIQDSYSEAILRASGNTDGATSSGNIGGAIGKMTGGALTRVLAFNTLKSSNRMTADHTFGGLVGSGVSATCINSFYTGASDGYACGSRYSYSASRTQSNLTSFGFVIPTKVGAWDAAANPSPGFTCTTPDNGKYYEAISAAPTTSFGTVLPGDIILCNGSTISLVPLMKIDSVLTSFPYTWSMPDDTYDVPRLSFESKIENAVPYLKRDCHGHFATQFGSGTATDPKWVCNYSQFAAMAGNGTNYILKNNIFMDVTQHNPLSPGVYNLDGNGFALYDFFMVIPTNISSNLNYGIFSKLNTTSSIRNLNIEGAVLTGTNIMTSANPSFTAGILAGNNSGEIVKVNIGTSRVVVNATTVAGDNFSIGGAVGYNAGAIRKSRLDLETAIDQGSYPASSTLYAGGTVGYNSGTLEGVRSHSSLARFIACTTPAMTLSFMNSEVLGSFVGYNAFGTVKEVEADGEFRAQFASGSMYNNCLFDENGSISPFIAANTGTVQDFNLNPRIWLQNQQALVHPLFAQSSGGTITRGIVHYDARDSFSFLQGQTFVDSGLTWNPMMYPSSGGNAPTIACPQAQAGQYITVSAASSSTSNVTSNVMGVMLYVGDLVVCNGLKNIVVPNAIKAKLLATAPSISDVIVQVKNPQGYCSNTNFFTSSECMSNSGTWTSGTSRALASGRYYDDALDFSVGASGPLVVKQAGASIPSFSGTGWTIATDFFNPGANTWLLEMHNGMTSSPKSPELVKTAGGLEDLGAPF